MDPDKEKRSGSIGTLEHYFDNKSRSISWGRCIASSSPSVQGVNAVPAPALAEWLRLRLASALPTRLFSREFSP